MSKQKDLTKKNQVYYNIYYIYYDIVEKAFGRTDVGLRHACVTTLSMLTTKGVKYKHL